MATLNLDQFYKRIRPTQHTFGLSENTRRTTSASGISHVSEFGPRLWQGTFSGASQSHDSQREIEALMMSIMEAGTTFDWTPPKRRFPIADRNGSKLGNATPRITNPTAGRSVTISGLPAAYQLSVGDYFSYFDATAKVNRLFLIMETKRASAAGNVTVQILNPFYANILPANNTAIDLINPRVTVRYVQNSLKAGSVHRAHTEGSSISFIEAVKA